MECRVLTSAVEVDVGSRRDLDRSVQNRGRGAGTLAEDESCHGIAAGCALAV